MTKKISHLIVGVSLSALVLAGCSPDKENDSSNSEATSAAPFSAETSKSTAATDKALTFEDAVVRANEDKDMTAIFGTLVNHSDEDIEITGFSTDLDAEMNQIHETVDGQMREKSSPLVIKAGESYELAPGGDHFMLMGMKESVMPGDSLKLTVTLAGGDEIDLGTIQARTMGAGDENYGDMEGMGHSGHGHAGHDHAGHDHAGHDHAGHDHAGHDHSDNNDQKENHKH
ncbi:copper chaperone PCu(A)C [Corynebacterium macginleyi]|uniref:copper chaperone PCu(A)C n=1 Tax=Corynebacterium macginleyi TaxID=38290 RepID=UPI00190A395B|nr:copper chaperone PCu(A)C [Corynebacterium macginleyi]MBK4148483.1 copper chaperone PCu(A)C [Corynebacterium macginleyi]